MNVRARARQDTNTDGWNKIAGVKRGFPLRGMFRDAFLFAFIVTAGFCPGVAPVWAAGMVEYKLGAGDLLRVVVFGHEALSGEFQVKGSGHVSLPLIREVKAVGLTLRQLEQAITDALKPDFLINPRVSVEILNYRPFYIIGEVKRPGSYPYVNGMTVVNAIALAGGYTYRGRENKVLITRASDAEKKQEPADHKSLVLPGDVIEVPERFW